MFKHLKTKLCDTTTQDDPGAAPLPVTDDQTPDASGTAATTQDPITDPDLPVENPESDDEEIVEIIADSDDISEEALRVQDNAKTLSAVIEAYAVNGASPSAAEFAKEAYKDAIPEAALESLADDPTGGEMIRLAVEDLSDRLSHVNTRTVQLVQKARDKVSSCNDQFSSLTSSRVLSKKSVTDLAAAVENLQIDAANLARLSGGVSTYKVDMDKTQKAYSQESFDAAIDLSVESLSSMPDVRNKTLLGLDVLSGSVESLQSSPVDPQSFSAKAQLLKTTAQLVNKTMKDYAVIASLLY